MKTKMPLQHPIRRTDDDRGKNLALTDAPTQLVPPAPVAGAIDPLMGLAADIGAIVAADQLAPPPPPRSTWSVDQLLETASSPCVQVGLPKKHAILKVDVAEQASSADRRGY